MKINNSKKTTLRELLEQGPVFAPCVYDCTSAKVDEMCGFKAMCLSGGEVSQSLVGMPDLGLVTQDELVSVVNHICDMSPLPMIVDIDTGFGNELNVMRTCERVAKAGGMAVHLEDQTFPKRCGHLTGKQVIPSEEYFAKVRAAHYVLKDTDCLLIARTDSYNINGKEDAISRCLGALDAGADITLAEGIDSYESIQEIGRRVPSWKMFGMSSAGASPKVTFEQLVEWGYNLVTMHFTMRGALTGMFEFGKKTFETMSDVYACEHVTVPNGVLGIYELYGIHDWLKLAGSFGGNVADCGAYKPKD